MAGTCGRACMPARAITPTRHCWPATTRLRYACFCTWRCRRCAVLVTLGTPFSGSAKAIATLTGDAYARVPRFAQAITDVARSFPSMHQLLPTYRCIEDANGVKFLADQRMADLNEVGRRDERRSTPRSPRRSHATGRHRTSCTFWSASATTPCKAYASIRRASGPTSAPNVAPTTAAMAPWRPSRPCRQNGRTARRRPCWRSGTAH